MKTITAADIADMPVEERLQLVNDIWDSIAELPEAVPVPDWHKEELKTCLEEYHKNPNDGSPWMEVKQRILGH